MPSKKAILAAVLLMLIVPGGILLGLTISPVTGAAREPPTQPLGGGAYSSLGALATSNFGAASLSGGEAGPTTVLAGGTVTMTTAISSSTVTMSTTTMAGTTVRGGPTQSLGLGAGASLAPSAPSNGTGDIEFFTNVTILAASAPTAFAKATAVAYSYGGYVSDSTETNDTALVVMRIPAASDQEALSQIESLGALVTLSSSSDDVTVQYTDLNATLQSLQTEQASLLSILGESTNINSTLNVESRLQGVDQSINSVESQILQTRTLISYATISALIQQKAPVQPLSIRLTATPRSGTSPLSVTFNALVKGGEQPYIVNYNFGDGSSYQGQALIHTFEQPGSYNVTVTATDASANVTEAWTVVSVSAPPPTSSFGGFPSFVGGLFLRVVEGIVEVAVVVLPIAAAVLVVFLPLRNRLGARRGGERAQAPPPG